MLDNMPTVYNTQVPQGARHIAAFQAAAARFMSCNNARLKPIGMPTYDDVASKGIRSAHDAVVVVLWLAQVILIAHCAAA